MSDLHELHLEAHKKAVEQKVLEYEIMLQLAVLVNDFEPKAEYLILQVAVDAGNMNLFRLLLE